MANLLTLDSILGQNAAIGVLRRAYVAGRLPHGLIFAGPVGVGKATTAGALAALFLCQKPGEASPCGVCESCRLSAAENHPDFHLITKELIRFHDKTGKSKGIDLSIHVIRPELVDAVGRKPMMNVGKVFVIEQADLMTTEAQNAILKTLEEPAGRTLIILLTDRPDSLLPTIRSRCQMIRFAPLPAALVETELRKRGVEARQAADATAFADGSLGLALKWLADGVIDRARELRQAIEDLLSGQAVPDLPEWFKKAAEAYAEKQIARDELTSRDQASREAIRLYLRLAARDLRQRLTEMDDPIALERICAGIDALARGEEHLDANVNISLIFQQLLVTLENLFANTTPAR